MTMDIHISSANYYELTLHDAYVYMIYKGDYFASGTTNGDLVLPRRGE